MRGMEVELLIGVVFIQDMRYCPYFERYAQVMAQCGQAYECIWWERWPSPPATPLPEGVLRANARHVFARSSEMARPPWRKSRDFLDFGRFARGVIAARGYDRLIVLTTLSGMLLIDWLLTRYRGRYLLDIRDESYERCAPFRLMEGALVDRSFFTCISSRGFLQCLPSGKEYLLVDNIAPDELRQPSGARFVKKPRGEVLTVSFIGFIRYLERNLEIIDRLTRDERFRVEYHGAGADYQRLCDYQAALPAAQRDRLIIGGYYDQQRDRPQLYRRADIINNYYPPAVRVQRLATSNKVYDALYFRRPQLVARGTYLEDLIAGWGVGAALDAASIDFADQLYEAYHAIDEDAFERRARGALAEAAARAAVYEERIAAFCNLGEGRN